MPEKRLQFSVDRKMFGKKGNARLGDGYNEVVAHCKLSFMLV